MALRMAVVSVLCLLFVGCGGDDDSGGAIAGTYHLVKDQQLMDGVKATMMHDERPGPDAVEQLKAMVDEMAMTLRLEGDGTFEVEGKMGARFTASGTWKQEGEEVVLTSTHEDGKPRDDPEVSRFRVEGKRLLLPRDDKKQPFNLYLERG